MAYHPSSLEEEWNDYVATLDTGSLKTHSFCGAIVSPPFREAMQAWVELGATQNANRPQTPEGLMQQAVILAARLDVFSRMRTLAHRKNERFTWHLSGHVARPPVHPAHLLTVHHILPVH